MVLAARGSLGNIYLTAFGQAIYFSPLKWLVVFAPLALVFFFSFQINRISASTARALFFVFSAAMGLSLSTLVLVYTGNSIARAFFITAGSFGALSLYGYTTPRSLSAMGSFMMMGLFGLIIASVVNIFLHSTGLQFALSILTVIIFAGLTAWDTQSIKEMYYASDDLETAARSRSTARCASISTSSTSSSRCCSLPARATTDADAMFRICAAKAKTLT